MPLLPGSACLSDRIGFLPARQMKNRKNPMGDAVREIVVKTEAGRTLRLLTNDLDAPADEIADLYRRRWRIELFFRVMKQTLRITAFVGRSENAVRIQIAVALIAICCCACSNRFRKTNRAHSMRCSDSCAQISCTEKTPKESETPAPPPPPRPQPTRPILPQNLNRTAVGRARP